MFCQTASYSLMRLNGIGKTPAEEKCLALQIGHAVARSGTTAKMDETLSAISEYVQKSASSTLTGANYLDFMGMLTAMAGSNYLGLKGNVGNSASLINSADAGVRSSGSGGEASEFQWIQAQLKAFPGLSWTDISTNQQAGLLGDLGAAYKPGSPQYDTATPQVKAHYESIAKSLSGKTMLDIYYARSRMRKTETH